MLPLLFAGFLSCNKPREIPVPDVAQIEVNLNFIRLDRILKQADTAAPYAPLPRLAQDYPGIYECYTGNILGFLPHRGQAKPDLKEISAYLNYPGFKAAMDSVARAFPELDAVQEELHQAFRYMRYHLPQRPIPDVFTFVSEYRYGAVTCYDSLLGIGLDMYLGKDFTFYPALGYPQYIMRRMTPEFIVRDAMMSLAQNDFGRDVTSDLLLDRMIHQGKLLYYLDLTLPETPDSIKIGYSAAELQWCKENEAEIWAYFLEDDRLFMNDRIRGSHYISTGPSTMGMPPEAPGNVGSWVGWQIVREFMWQNPEISLAELMQMQNGQKILRLSAYKP